MDCIPISKQEIFLHEDEDDDLTIDEEPISFQNRLAEQDLIAEREDIVHGMIVQKRELCINYENGSGISQLYLFHKDRIVHSIFGSCDKQSKW